MQGHDDFNGLVHHTERVHNDKSVHNYCDDDYSGIVASDIAQASSDCATMEPAAPTPVFNEYLEASSAASQLERPIHLGT